MLVSNNMQGSGSGSVTGTFDFVDKKWYAKAPEVRAMTEAGRKTYKGLQAGEEVSYTIETTFTHHLFLW